MIDRDASQVLLKALADDNRAMADMGRELARLRKAMRIAHDLCKSAAPKQAVGEVLADALSKTEGR